MRLKGNPGRERKAEAEAAKELRARGGKWMRAKNKDGYIQGGWWIDGVWLSHSSREALQLANGQ
jgi:hypothetical protein